MLGISAPVGQALSLAQLAQFPWRLLTFTVISMAFLCGAAAIGARPAKGLVDLSTLILVALLILGSLPYVKAELSEQEVSIANLMRFQQSADEMTGSTAWVKEIPTWSSMADYHIAGEPVTSKVNYGFLYAQPGENHARTLELGVYHELVEYLAQDSPVMISFDTFYYPGWHAYQLDPENNEVIEELPIAKRGDLGLMTVRVPQGLGRVLLQFEDTPVRKLGTFVTFASLALMIVLALASIALKLSKPRGRREERS